MPRYLRGTMEYGLRYLGDHEVKLEGYINSDCIGSAIEINKRLKEWPFNISKRTPRVQKIDLRRQSAKIFMGPKVINWYINFPPTQLLHKISIWDAE